MSTATCTADAHLTTSEIAERLGVAAWQVRRVLDAEGLARRLGLYRFVMESELPAVEAALARFGYLDPSEGKGVAG